MGSYERHVRRKTRQVQALMGQVTEANDFVQAYYKKYNLANYKPPAPTQPFFVKCGRCDRASTRSCIPKEPKSISYSMPILVQDIKLQWPMGDAKVFASSIPST